MNRRTFFAVAAGAAFVGTPAVAEAKQMQMGDAVFYPRADGSLGKGLITGFSHASAEHAKSVPGHKKGDNTVVVDRGLRFFPEQVMALTA